MNCLILNMMYKLIDFKRIKFLLFFVEFKLEVYNLYIVLLLKGKIFNNL